LGHKLTHQEVVGAEVGDQACQPFPRLPGRGLQTVAQASTANNGMSHGAKPIGKPLSSRADTSRVIACTTPTYK
jgi:hypothetical protein